MSFSARICASVFGLAPEGPDGEKFPTPLNVALEGVAKLGGAGGTP
jgi:hypothetical protein